ncbi:uncharacterized protein HMPREF1120_05079 [Exophiala dermatitidis NIH/UT8656]|uniref:Uncharacterized protein n=1 Tax=Exophiala dermatitidis (strain ATCC 34100 / CBS 525.76 / NIH/UT8656) TaxID=858893 RepID=H6BZG3_EXODN|nr:uncharacterized protein HMPREF1120_05079 [Exophiala dermatitidis NIH/UT8656]EHY57026.1 hypothetical protein HMPREF1120_05079 [Exophiala dermatitidis NIH/UT8656]
MVGRNRGADDMKRMPIHFSSVPIPEYSPKMGSLIVSGRASVTVTHCRENQSVRKGAAIFQILNHSQNVLVTCTASFPVSFLDLQNLFARMTPIVSLLVSVSSLPRLETMTDVGPSLVQCGLQSYNHSTAPRVDR